MASLDLTVNQQTLLETLNNIVDEAFGTGITVASAPYIPGQKNWDNLRELDRTAIHVGFKQTVALIIAALGIDQVGLGTPSAPVVVALAPLNENGTPGSLTIIGGLIVAKVDPTLGPVIS